MLILLFVYCLVQGASIDAGPIPSFDNRSSPANHCTDLDHCRTLLSIVWSCFATIFACTWASIHPNVPCPKKREADSWIHKCIWNPLLSFAEHRLPLFICALFVPEYVLAWAIRQFLRARHIAKENKKRRWSMTHGFFIIMGGFHLFERGSEETDDDDRGISQENDKPLHPLQASDLVQCNGYSEFFMPTEVEIKDRGKNDWLAKSLVMLQTSWFVMQCIARAIEHLPVTHLEIVTLAYAAVNFATYIFWWNKPLNVNRPIRVFRKSEPGEMEPQVREPIPGTRELTWDAIHDDLRTIFFYIIGCQDNGVVLSREDKVPRFWADNKEDFIFADFIVLGVGVCFGAIHCIAWLFSLPTHTELLMWRISSVAITAFPIYIGFGFFLATWANFNVGVTEVILALSLFLLPGLLCTVARSVTLVLAFASLRDLPPGAYEAVRWTTFIPHI